MSTGAKYVGFLSGSCTLLISFSSPALEGRDSGLGCRHCTEADGHPNRVGRVVAGANAERGHNHAVGGGAAVSRCGPPVAE